MASNVNIPTLSKGAPIEAFVPSSLDDVFKIANLFIAAKIAPDTFKGDANMVAIAIMKGAEVGLPPITSVQNICVVNNRPCVWGDGAVAIARASGKLRYIKESIDASDPKNPVAHCEVLRVDEDEPVIKQFSMEDAKVAGLLNKAIWRQYPKRMLAMRARAYALRDTFADALSGIAIADEVQDYASRDITSKVDTSFLEDECPEEKSEPQQLPAPETGSQEPNDEEELLLYKKIIYAALWSCSTPEQVQTEANKLRESATEAWQNAIVNAGEERRLAILHHPNPVDR